MSRSPHLHALRHHTMPVILAFLCSIGLLVHAAPSTPAAAATSIHLSRSSAAPGDVVVVTGAGFTPQSAVVVAGTFTVGGHSVEVQAVTTASSSGTISVGLIVPAGATPSATAGPATIVARDFEGHSATQTLTILTVVTLTVGRTSSATIVADEPFEIRGSGFRPGEGVTLTVPFPLYNGNIIVVSRVLTTNAQGTLNQVVLQAPVDTRAETVHLTARGRITGRQAAANLTIVYRPAIMVTSPSVAPGGSISVRGQGFIPGTTITVSVPLVLPGVSSATVSRSVVTDSRGTFTVSLSTPPSAQPGTYTVTAADTAHGLRATARVTVSIHPAITVLPTVVLPGQTITVTGGGFGVAVQVTVRAAVRLTSGATVTVATAAITGSGGGFSARLTIPGGAASGAVTVTAASQHGQASAALTVRQPPPVPRATSTPVPTSTPIPTPTPTATPAPLPPLPPSRPKPPKFGYISIWYHNLRPGSDEHIQVQGKPHTTLGIWVHVYFPNNRHLDYFQNTDETGFWQTTFKVPQHALTPQSNRVVVTIRLWHGKLSKRTFRTFTLFR